MTRHILAGRSDNEVLWVQRRGFLQAAAAWTTLGGWTAVHAQQRSNIVELRGDALLNASRMEAQSHIQTGDRIETGPGTSLVFVIGNSSFLVRQNTVMTVERGASLHAVSVLRLLTGAVASVWGRAATRRIITPTLTAGIRGTGVYTEVLPQADRTYFCTCYGEVEMNAGGDQAVSRAQYHESFWADREAKDGRRLLPAGALNHTDEELELLARLVEQRTAWQVTGKKGTKGAY